MAVIQSGATSDQLTVDPTSKAARVTLYNAAGVELNQAPTTAHVLSLPMLRFTAATAAGSTVFAMRNGATKTIRIRQLLMTIGFDGTAAASHSMYEWVRFSTATPTGGTPITLPAGAVKKRSSYGNSTLADARYGTAGAALTVTSVVFETPFANAGVPRGATGMGVVWPCIFNISNDPNDCFELAANEGLALRLTVIAVIGDLIQGMIEWNEV